jgi:phosphopantothenoylcysteine decarboxylase / phosphopantothenate---cysteine ligase
LADRLAGIRVVVTAGGTREPVDAVRYLGNRSSGKMGNALACAAAEQGAQVTLITTVDPPPLEGVVVRVDTAAQMQAAVQQALPTTDVLLMAAAVADYRPAHPQAGKLKKRDAPWQLELVPTEDILESLRDHPARPGVLVVGFAAETDDLLANAQRKLERKGLDLIVLNDIGAPGIGMGADHNAVTLIDAHGVVAQVDRAPKAEIARAVLHEVSRRLRR